MHAGGSTGAVQLIALAAGWRFLDDGRVATAVAAGITIATWAFFFGPLARALGHAELGRRINLAGAWFAVPAYVLLPTLLRLG